MRIMSPEEAKKFEENEQIQYVVGKFQDAMAKFAGFEAKTDEIYKLFLDLSEKVSGLVCDQSNFSNIISGITKDVSGNSLNAETKASLITSSIVDLVNNLAELKSEVGEIQKQIAPIYGQFTSIKDSLSNFATTAHFSDLKQTLKNVVDEVRSKYQDHEEKFVSSSNKADSHMLFSQSLSQDMFNLGNDRSKIFASLTNLASDAVLGKQYVESSLSDMQEKLLNYINDSIASIPQPVIPSLDDAKKVIEDKITPIYLDAKNANLRSSNNENKLLILEKRIEQLQLLINKLQNQG